MMWMLWRRMSKKIENVGVEQGEEHTEEEKAGNVVEKIGGRAR